jgi:hypothetical protein
VEGGQPQVQSLTVSTHQTAQMLGHVVERRAWVLALLTVRPLGAGHARGAESHQSCQRVAH